MHKYLMLRVQSLEADDPKFVEWLKSTKWNGFPLWFWIASVAGVHSAPETHDPLKELAKLVKEHPNVIQLLDLRFEINESVTYLPHITRGNKKVAGFLGVINHLMSPNPVVFTNHTGVPQFMLLDEYQALCTSGDETIAGIPLRGEAGVQEPTIDLAEENEALRSILRKAQALFHKYAEYHEAKGTDDAKEKAVRNFQMVEDIRVVLERGAL